MSNILRKLHPSLARTLHQLHLSLRSNLATCRCGRWSLTDIRKPLTEEAAKKSYELHKELTKKEAP